MFASLTEVAATFPWFFPGVAFAIGACIGSFLNVVIYRVPKEESIVTPGSHCACGQPIKWYDNIPILSWLALRGRTPGAVGGNFPFRYPAVELLTALLFVACWLRFSAPAGRWRGVRVDFSELSRRRDVHRPRSLHHPRRVHDRARHCVVGVLLSAPLVPALHVATGGMPLVDSLRSGTASLLGLLVGSGLVLWIALFAEAILKKEAMGFGDVKFVGAIGAFCGWQGAVFSIFGGALVGTVWFAIRMAVAENFRQGLTRRAAIRKSRRARRCRSPSARKCPSARCSRSPAPFISFAFARGWARGSRKSRRCF